MIIWLHQVKKTDKPEIGNKFYHLALASQAGLPVPNAFCICNSFFKCWANRNGLEPENSVINGFSSYIDLRQRVLGGNFSEEEKQILFFHYRKITEKNQVIAVRSSAMAEDTYTSSLAGKLFSMVGITTFDDFLVNIKRCYASLFQISVEENIPMVIGVIAQNMVLPRKSGVLFTINPITGDDQQILIESVTGFGGKLVSGKSTGMLYRVRRSDYNVVSQPPKSYSNMSEEEIKTLADMALKCEELFSNGLDIEWVKGNSGFYLLQVRPITTGRKQKEVSGTCFCDADNPKAHYLIPNIESNDIYLSWFTKKRWARYAAVHNGYRVIKAYWLSYQHDTLSPAFLSILTEYFDTEHVMILYGKRPFVKEFCPKNEIEQTLKKIISQKTRISNQLVVNIREYPLLKVVGFSHILENGSVLLEYALHSLQELKSGNIPVSTYLFDADLRLIDHNTQGDTFRTVYDPHKRTFVRVPDPSLSFTIKEQHLKELLALTNIMRAYFGNVIVEWGIDYNNVLYFWDFSIESTSIPVKNFEKLSSGNLFGRVFKLENIELIEEIMEGYDFSIKNYDNSIEKAMKVDSIANLLRHIETIPEPRICIAKYPIPSLSVLVDKFQGFIFESGPILCHFAIILREKNIPAMIIKDSFSMFTNGKFIEINNERE